MNKDGIKSLAIFLVITGVIFYGAHIFAGDSEVTFSTENARSTTFLNLVQVLNGIEFDLDFVQSLGSGRGGVQNPVIIQDVYDGRTGRANPFAPASSQNTFSLISRDTLTDGQFEQFDYDTETVGDGIPNEEIITNQPDETEEPPVEPPQIEQTLTLP